MIMTKEEAKEILAYMRMAFLPEEYINMAVPYKCITDEQVDEALKLAIASLAESDRDMTFDQLNESVL